MKARRAEISSTAFGRQKFQTAPFNTQRHTSPRGHSLPGHSVLYPQSFMRAYAGLAYQINRRTDYCQRAHGRGERLHCTRGTAARPRVAQQGKICIPRSLLIFALCNPRALHSPSLLSLLTTLAAGRLVKTHRAHLRIISCIQIARNKPPESKQSLSRDREFTPLAIKTRCGH